MSPKPPSTIPRPLRASAVVACLLLAPVALASADTLIDTGTGSFDNWNFSSAYFALGFTATGPANVDGFSILVGTTTSAAVTGSAIDIYKNHPSDPTSPSDLVGTLAYASIAADSGRSRVSFTGSVTIPAAGDYWAKWRNLPSGQSVWIRMGGAGTPAPWNIKTGAWYLNGSVSSGLTTSYFPKFRITGSAVAAPTVSAVTPAQGPSSGGTSVAITGTGLTGATGVYFGGTAAASFTVDSATQITAVTPARTAGAIDVAVTTGGGSTALAEAFRFEATSIGGAEETAVPAQATRGTAPERPRTSSVGSLARRAGSRPGIQTFSASVRTERAGRYTILFENQLGQRVPLHRGSRVGSRTLRTLVYAVVVNASAGQSLPVAAALREAATAGLRIRVIHRDETGALAGEEARAG